MAPGAVVVGAHVNALGVIRALAGRGIQVAAVSTRPFDFAHHSRWVSDSHALPELHDRPESLVDFLEQREARWPGWAVFPTNDDSLTALAQNHERLSRVYRLPVQPWEVAADVVDKDRMHALAEKVGLDLPVCHGGLDAAPDSLAYPVLVKPIQHDRLISLFGTKLFLARDQKQFGAARQRLEKAGLDGLVFDYVPGPDSGLYSYCVYIDDRGEPSPGVMVRKLRQDPPLIGGASLAEIAPELPVLREATVELLRRAGFRGMAFVEFKLDPRSGRFVFIEVNGRAVQFNGLLGPTGIDLVGMAWSDFVLGERLRPRPTGWRGRWIHLQGEVKRFLSERLPVADLVAPYRGPKTYAVWSASDPGPFLRQTALGLRRAVKDKRRT